MGGLFVCYLFLTGEHGGGGAVRSVQRKFIALDMKSARLRDGIMLGNIYRAPVYDIGRKRLRDLTALNGVRSAGTASLTDGRCESAIIPKRDRRRDTARASGQDMRADPCANVRRLVGAPGQCEGKK